MGEATSFTTGLLIGAGAFVGAILRYSIGLWGLPVESTAIRFPWTTFAINVGGSLLLGVLVRLLSGNDTSYALRLGLTVGFCGGFTTFSTFSQELAGLLEQRAWGTAVLYGSLSMFLGTAAFAAGYAIATRIVVTTQIR